MSAVEFPMKSYQERVDEWLHACFAPHRKDDPYVIEAMRGLPAVIFVLRDRSNTPK